MITSTTMNLTALTRSIGAQVRNQRIALGITQKELASQTGTSERLIRSLEMGEARGIGLGKLVDILAPLNLGLAVVSDEVETSSKGSASVSQGTDYTNALKQMVSSRSETIQDEVLQ